MTCHLSYFRITFISKLLKSKKWCSRLRSFSEILCRVIIIQLIGRNIVLLYCSEKANPNVVTVYYQCYWQVSQALQNKHAEVKLVRQLGTSSKRRPEQEGRFFSRFSLSRRQRPRPNHPPVECYQHTTIRNHVWCGLAMHHQRPEPSPSLCQSKKGGFFSFLKNEMSQHNHTPLERNTCKSF